NHYNAHRPFTHTRSNPMPRRAALLLLILAATARADDADILKKLRPLPGVQSDGSIRLPNAWSIQPAGKQLELGDFPVNIALHPSGKWLAVLHAGYGTHEIQMIQLDGKKEQVRSRVEMEQTFY